MTELLEPVCLDFYVAGIAMTKVVARPVFVLDPEIRVQDTAYCVYTGI